MRSLTRSVYFLLLLAMFSAGMLSLAPAETQAQCATGAKGFVPLECFEGSPRLADTYREESFGVFLNRVFVGAIVTGAMLAVLRLAWAGFVYMGTDIWGKKEHAKEIITDTLIGLFLLLAIWLILNQINPQLVSLHISEGQQTPAQPTTQTVTPAAQNPNSGLTPFQQSQTTGGAVMP